MPCSSGIAHNLAPELRAKILEAFVTFDFRRSGLAKEFKDTERFAPINYREHWRDVRTVQRETGVRYTQESLTKLGTKE